VSSFTLVSDLKTPAFLIDIDMLYKAAQAPTTPSNTIPTGTRTAHTDTADTAIQNDLNFIPPMHLPKYNMTLYPYALKDDIEPTQIKEPYTVNQYQGQQSALGYLHSSVIRSRDDLDTSSTETTTTLLPSTFLAELDIGIDLCGGSSSSQQQEQESPPPPPPQLVMGINNHHVGSYYWARSAGMGASMETPGILFQNCPISTATATSTTTSSSGSSSGSGRSTSSTSSSNTGMLCWEGNTPFDCNSNDGKRSEWVNFLRVGDLVQLLPQDLEDALVAFVNRYQEQDEEQQHKEENQEEVGGESEDRSISSRIYGFSSKGRPLGSEPMVVCQWCKR